MRLQVQHRAGRLRVQLRDVGCNLRLHLSRELASVECSCARQRSFWVFWCLFCEPLATKSIVPTGRAVRAARAASRARIYVKDRHISLNEHSCASCRCTHSPLPNDFDV